MTPISPAGPWGLYGFRRRGKKTALEVAFDELRSVYRPTADLSTMDLSRSTFYLPDGEEDPYMTGNKDLSKGGLIAAHETEGVVDYLRWILGLAFDRIRPGACPATATVRAGDHDPLCERSARCPRHSVVSLWLRPRPRGSPFLPLRRCRPTCATLSAGDLDGMVISSADRRFPAHALPFGRTGCVGTKRHEDPRRTADLTRSYQPRSIIWLPAMNRLRQRPELSAGLNVPGPCCFRSLLGTMYTMESTFPAPRRTALHPVYKIDGQRRKGDEPYDAGNEPRDPSVRFPVRRNRPTIGVAIGSDGIESSITERA